MITQFRFDVCNKMQNMEFYVVFEFCLCGGEGEGGGRVHHCSSRQNLKGIRLGNGIIHVYVEDCVDTLQFLQLLSNYGAEAV